MTYSRIVRSCLYYVRRTLCRHNFLQGPARARREAHTAPQSAAVGTGLPLRGKYPTTAVVLLPRTPRHQAPIGLAQHIGPPCTIRCMPTGQWGVLSFRVPARADCTLRHGDTTRRTNPKEQHQVVAPHPCFITAPGSPELTIVHARIRRFTHADLPSSLPQHSGLKQSDNIRVHSTAGRRNVATF